MLIVKPKSQTQVPNPKSKVQRKRTGTGADTIILQETNPPHPTTPPITFLTWNVNPVMGKDHPWPSLTFLDLPWPSLTFHDLPWLSMTSHDLLWPSMTFYHFLRPLWPSMIKCLLSRPGLIAGPLHSTPLPNNSQSIPRLDPIDSKSSLTLLLLLSSFITPRGRRPRGVWKIKANFLSYGSENSKFRQKDTKSVKIDQKVPRFVTNFNC